jgi:hypothetical protein
MEKRYLKTVTGLTHAKARCGFFDRAGPGSAVSKTVGRTKLQAPGGSGASPSSRASMFEVEAHSRIAKDYRS